jgi:hypothetical protein
MIDLSWLESTAAEIEANGSMIPGYAGAMAARTRACAERKAAQVTETEEAKAAALRDAAEYMARLDLDFVRGDASEAEDAA